ncbi:MAG: 4-amino-4-deoxy-L-arabinose-phospho-UDP flippase [Chromatiales bacterium]|nr:MAG: 4-amino-4-deoxy-L-arabinose-phospho-UDP flippase [Chromatiales bacterium]
MISDELRRCSSGHEESVTNYAYLLIAVVLVSIGQILQKLAAGQLNTDSSPAALLVSLARSVWFWLAIFVMASALLVWLLALATIEVSKAYPVLALSFALTTCLSVVILKERVGAASWFGVFLITVGAAMMLVS